MGQQLTDDLSRLLAGRKPDLMDKRGEFSVLVPLVEGDEGLSPVSYTHLDVYKRQILRVYKIL